MACSQADDEHSNEACEDRCAICLEEMVVGKVLEKCQHRFHETCLAEWVTHSSVCPLCRTSIKHIHEVAITHELSTWRRLEAINVSLLRQTARPWLQRCANSLTNFTHTLRSEGHAIQVEARGLFNGSNTTLPMLKVVQIHQVGRFLLLVVKQDESKPVNRWQRLFYRCQRHMMLGLQLGSIAKAAAAFRELSDDMIDYRKAHSDDNTPMRIHTHSSQ
eukprot:TRINITY_DN23964_c0_g1_i1.p1 TRINITY_DN23964_c0_g1~~TRINITY_DN23964_c0_g1_i1.p1  ORF type:complete len:218 (+),score=20.25 TRINITY_DN23964_c0_g1_i1:144-797(+)